MLSKSVFDLDQSNNPVIALEVKSSDDVRDKIAKRFTEKLATESRWCEILPNGSDGWVVFPLGPSELRKQAENMLAAAKDYEEACEKYRIRVEG